MESCRAVRRSNRSCTTAAGTWSAISPAGVPGRIEYWNVNAEENSEASTTSSVSWKSCSVSPGKPTMMSVVMAACGMRSRTRSRIPRNFLDRYERRMSFRIRSEPDCSGMCSCGITFGVSAMASITSSVKAAGWGLVNRTRSSPWMSPHARSSLAKAPRSPNSTP